MNSARLKRWVLTAVAAATIGSGAASSQTPAAIFTKNAALRLPVQLDERSRADVAEVKLYVRGPAGRWECVQSAPSTQPAFDYRAPADGEYSFTFVTVDRRGAANPPSVEAAAPHRVVIVDATAPELAAQPIPFRGEKALQCQVRDANPDWSTLRVGYLSSDGRWQALNVAAADTPTVFKVPTPAVLEGKIRVTVADRAGNRTTREMDLGDPSAPLGLPRAAVENGRPDPTLFTKEAGAEGIVAPVSANRSVHGGTELPKAPPTDIPDLPDLPDISRLKPPSVNPEIKLPETPGVPSPKIPDTPVLKGGDELMKIPDVPSMPAVPGGIKAPVDIPPPPVVPASGSTEALKPADVPTAIAPPAETRPTAEMKPLEPGSHPVLNSRTCSINYQVDGPARLAAKMDFWATADSGRTWVKLKDGNNGTPPARLTLPGDGVFGIRIRPGGGTKPPEPGEDPDCVVEVDTAKPSVMLQTPVVGAEDGVMMIGWEASDKHLLSNTINLYFAAKPDGPWEVIVHGYKNTGSYRWSLPTGLTGPVYLRMEASDKAGNVGRHDLAIPVALESAKVRVRVTGVGPAQ